MTDGLGSPAVNGDPLAFARRLVAHGVPVFACPPGGTADGYQLPQGWQTLRADPRRLDVWRDGWALAAVCGHGLDVVDVDPRNGGDEALRALIAAGALPRTYAIVDTPRGGKHLYVASLRVAKTKRDGIDLQAGTEAGGRGFVWLPPTERHGGTYVVRNDSLDAFGQDDDSGARLAEWFAEGKAARPAASSARTADERGDLEAGTPIPQGEHQGTLFRRASSMRALGVPESVAAAAIRYAAEHDCRPPWAGPDDAWNAVKHAYRYAEGVPRSSDDEPTLELVRPDGTPAPQAAPAARRRVVATPASTRTMRAARWLWEDAGHQWVPLGGLVLLGGREGIGKSTWGYRIAAQVTRGTLPGDMYGRPRGVGICATEDSWEHTVLPRLAAAGADLSRVYELTAVDGEVTSGITLPVDVAEVTQVCAEHDVGLLLLDPLLGTISGRLDTHKDAEVRQALEPLSRLAHDSEATVIGLIHENKGQGADLLTRLMGSRAFAAVARAVLVCAEEKSELQESDFGDALDLEKAPRRTFLFGQEKNNLGKRVEHSVRYEIEGALVGHDAELHKDVWSSRINPVGLADERVGDMVRRQEEASRPGRGRASGERDAAKTWLRDYLAAAGESVPSAQAVAMGKAAGHADKTVRRAANDLGVLMVRLPDMSTVWSLPKAG